MNLGAIASFMHPSADAVTVIGRLHVKHGLPLIPKLLAYLGLTPHQTPPGSSGVRVAVHADQEGQWLRSFEGSFVTSNWSSDTHPQSAEANTVSCTPRAERFGALQFVQTPRIDELEGRPRVHLEHTASRFLGIPFPRKLAGVYSTMWLHEDGLGWDLVVESSLLGFELVSYSGPLRLVRDQAQRAEARELLHHVVVFDGVCNMCNSSVDFILSRDTRRPPVFLMGSAQSKTAKTLLTSRGAAHLVDDLSSVLLLPAGGGVPVSRSDAALSIGSHLGQPWSGIAMFGRAVPRSLRDWVYDWIGKNRYTWFGRKSTCRIPTREERARFLSD